MSKKVQENPINDVKKKAFHHAFRLWTIIGLTLYLVIVTFAIAMFICFCMFVPGGWFLWIKKIYIIDMDETLPQFHFIYPIFTAKH